MTQTTMWIRDGSFVERPKKDNGCEYQDRVLFDKFNMVRIMSDSSGTHLQWNMARANWVSLMLATKLVTACVAPFTLKYFNAGWFEETLLDALTASDRIDQLIYKSDVRLSERTYRALVPPNLDIMPQGLRKALQTGTAPDSYSVVCAVDLEKEQSHVEHVGRDSAIARIWGVSPNSFPCLNGHGYDRVVTPEYFSVVESQKPHYDHVLASMVKPNGELHWVPYHRVILPEMHQGRHRVRVVSELAPVQIQLL
jgi:hypothetical protein